MPRLMRNAARCLQCGDVVESKYNHDYVVCGCGNIAVDGGPSYDRIAGRGLADGSWEPLHVFADGRTAAGNQFVPFLNGRFVWDGGDGWALHRLLAAMVSGTIPDPDSLSGAGRRRLGYLVGIVLTMSPEPVAETRLQALLADLRQQVRLEPEAMDQGWLPSRIAGPDEMASEWGLASGLSERFRRALRTRID